MKDTAQMTAGRYLILHLLQEVYPKTMPMPELKARYLDLIREHGGVEKAAAAVLDQQRKRVLQ